MRALVAVTGGPGAGKTALLELLRLQLGARATVLPEAAGIIYRGGFPRGSEDVVRRAAQHAIFHVQRQLERIAMHGEAPLVLCDRGTIDGLAYWPGTDAEYYAEMGVERAAEIARYTAVLHLRTPPAANGYTQANNPLRIETPAEAGRIDERILRAWEGHPRRTIVPWCDDFTVKMMTAVEALRALARDLHLDLSRR